MDLQAIWTVLAWFLIGVAGGRADLTDYRTKLPVRADAVVRVYAQTADLALFRGTVEAHYLGSGHRLEPGTLYENADNAHVQLERLLDDFVSVTVTYALVHLREYCQMSVRLINAAAADARHDREKILETVGFGDGGGHRYCLMSALHDFRDDTNRIDDDLIFDAAAFLQTVARDRSVPFAEVGDQLWKYLESLDDVLYEDERIDRDALPADSDDPSVLIDSLVLMKQDMIAFSNAFCSSWTPFVDGDLLFGGGGTTDDDDYLRRESAFVQHAFRNEQCSVSFEIYSSVVSQQNQILEWNCDQILETEEFSLREYIKHGNPPPPGNAAEKLPRSRTKEFSVAALRAFLRRNSYYMNAVKYYNVAAEVALLASVKEGRKVLKGIKHAVASTCRRRADDSENAAAAAREWRRLGSALSAYKSLHDRLIASLRDRKRIDVADRPAARAFDELAGEVARLLNELDDDGPDDERPKRVRRACAEIPARLQDLGDADPETYATTAVEFEEHYFTEPILNVRKLCRFGENGF